MAAWKFAEVQSWTTPEELPGEVRDEIDRLNGRPDSTGRCPAAVAVFRAEPSEERRAALREAYLVVPEHLRRYALGDMDSKDWPLKVLAAGPGARLPGGGPVTVGPAPAGPTTGLPAAVIAGGGRVPGHHEGGPVGPAPAEGAQSCRACSRSASAARYTSLITARRYGVPCIRPAPVWAW
ncbi:hypothetical protein [Kitasatospora sp. NPDC056531]|uniref:DUF7639 domain-containing protein n=1 Tax=Kitasatospora sp. NPDC056531 TaxID=3345856 RepID=UPI0036CBCC92